MGLLPLEFTDCLTDSPYFREILHSHEKELERTSQVIRGIIKDIRELITAAKTLSKAQRNLANTFTNFRFESIGNSQTDDEIMIAGSLSEFGRLLNIIEDERDRMIEMAEATFIEPLESFRKDRIGSVKEERKKFEKETARFYQFLERQLNLSTRKTETQLQEADAILEMEQRHFVQASLEYVLRLQEVHECKKFEFVERILSFMYRWFTFYHQGHEVATDFKSFMTDLQVRIQRTRENFDATRDEATELMNKMLEVRKTKGQDPGCLNRMYTRQGYLFLMEKKTIGTSWTKQFCQYQKDSKKFTMTAYSQVAGKINTPETLVVKECTRRPSETIDKRFCFDVVPHDKACAYTLQALSQKDLKLWLDAMGGKEPVELYTGKITRQEECRMDDLGYSFVENCLRVIKERGLEDQGLYRLVGVSSKVTKLITNALDPHRPEEVNLDDADEWEIKTITSALKYYYRNLAEPVMTYRLHSAFTAAAKQEDKQRRVNDIQSLVHLLPPANYRLLNLLIMHLARVSKHSDKNLMTVSNLGVCFGPTLLRPEEETVAAIMDIKFCNVVVEVLISNCEQIFEGTNAVRRSYTGSTFEIARKETSPQQDVYHRTNSMQETHAKDPADHYKRDANVVVRKEHTLRLVRESPGEETASSQSAFYTNRPQSYRGENPNTIVHPAYLQPPQQAPFVQTGKRQPLFMYNPSCQEKQSSPESMTPIRPNIPPSKSPYTLASNSYQDLHFHSQHIATPVFRQDRNQPSPARSPSSLNSTTTYPVATADIPGPGRTVRTLFACVAENETELSFKPNEIIYNVQPSRESGWLEGCLNGRVGLIPENYVQYLH